MLSASTQNFDKAKGNKYCLDVPWDSKTAFQKAWAEGKTGYPYIDGLMRQLKETGWIHHLGRHAVACFLTRGDLWQSWEVGRDIFSEYLLDGDYSLNSSNWMWLSASAFFSAYHRIYSPIFFGKRTDKN